MRDSRNKDLCVKWRPLTAVNLDSFEVFDRAGESTSGGARQMQGIWSSGNGGAAR
jgi:hypothetical protein